MDWSGLLYIGFGGFCAWTSWRWAVPQYESFYKVTRNRPADLGSFNFRIVRFSRWVCVVLGCVIAVAGVGILFGSGSH